MNCGVQLEFLANSTRWCITVIVSSNLLISVGTFLNLPSFLALWDAGFGAYDPRSMMSFAGGYENPMIGMIILANSPQVVASFLYFLTNALYTAMASADEWQRFSSHRKGLRVSFPEGQQRSTHFLSLPYRYSIPLAVTSTVLHWLVSQSIFLIRVTIMPNGSDAVIKEVTTCGWSSIAVIFLPIYSTMMLLTTFGIGFKKLHGTIPLAGECSAAISADCHPPATDMNASLLPLKWGALKGVGEEEGGIGHCTLTSEEVVTPIEGRLYAGI